MITENTTSVAFETLVDNFGEELILDFFEELRQTLEEIKEDFTPKQSGLRGWINTKIKDENKISYENTRLIGLAESLKHKADSLIIMFSPKLSKLSEILAKIKDEKTPKLSCEASTELMKTYLTVSVQENLIRINYFDTLIENLKKISATLSIVVQQMQMQQNISELLESFNIKKAINK